MTTDQATKNLLMYCYHCEQAHHCETEEKCRECWAEERYTIQQQERELTTEELLREYAL